MAIFLCNLENRRITVYVVKFLIKLMLSLLANDNSLSFDQIVDGAGLAAWKKKILIAGIGRGPVEHVTVTAHGHVEWLVKGCMFFCQFAAIVEDIREVHVGAWLP